MLFKHLFKFAGYTIIFFIELASVLLIAAAALFLILLYRPEWIVNESNLRFASAYVLPRVGVQLEFKSFKADFPSTSIYDRGLAVTFENIRLRTSSMTFIAPNAGAAAAFNIHPSHPALTMIGPLVVEEGIFAMTLAPKDPYEEEKPFEWDQELLTKIRAIKWEMISANFKEINIEQDKVTLLKGPMNLQVYNDKRNWKIAYESGDLLGTPVMKSNLKLDIRLPADIAASFPFDIKLDGGASIREQGPVGLDGTMTVNSLDDLRYKLNGSFGEGKKRVVAKVSGFFDKGRFLSQIDGSADGFVAQLPELAVRRCRLEGRYNFAGPEILNSNNNCEIVIERIPLPEELAFADLSPTKFTIKVHLPLKLTQQNKQTYLDAKNVRASIAPISNDVYRLKASVIGNFEGYLSASTDTIKSEVKVDSEIEIPEFANLVKRLEPTAYAIPAPLHTLKGRVACGTQGKIVNLGEQTDIPL
ncbi:MAG: hypothetical protein EOP07_24445, partial [Proteobacteria bacterium]